jgi:hypothetical protein
MKIKVYVNWDACEILNEKEFEKIVQRDANCRENDNDALNEFLEENYCFSDIFYMPEEEKELIAEKWKKDCDEWIRIELLEEGPWEEREIEI